MTVRGPIVAAGAVVLRREAQQTQVLLVHRPKYDDWSFPKGKLDPHEAPRTAAVREVLEETGVSIRLGPPLTQQTYSIGDGVLRPKVVHYWVGRARGEHDVAAYVPNHEVDRVRWWTIPQARERLSYAHDGATLEEALTFARKTQPLVVLRHAQARSRSRWSGDDRERTLTQLGTRQAEQLVPLLAAYGVERVLSSSSRRCWTTVAPYADAATVKLEVSDSLSEEDASIDGVADELDWLLDQRQAAVLCSHRPVLPHVFRALGIEPPVLDPAAALVVHHRKGRIAALERVAAPSGR